MSLSIPKGVTILTPQEIPKIHRRALPYYREHFALEAKEILDKLHATGKPLRVSAVNISVSSLRLQYYQGARYLLDNLDDQGKYLALYRQTKCSTNPGYIEFHIRIAARNLSAIEINAPWKDELTVFLDTAVANDKFYRDDVILNDDDIAWINNQITPLAKSNGDPLFYGQVEKNKILLIKDENPQDSTTTGH